MRIQETGGQLVITEVVPLSPAFNAGLEVGDLLLEVNGKPVRTEKEYSDAIDSSPRNIRLLIKDPNRPTASSVEAVLNP